MSKYFMPGPMRCSDEALEELGKPIFSHRTPEAREVYMDVIQKVGQILGTKGRVVPVCASGTAGVEFMVSNLVKPSDHVLCLVNGHFSERMRDTVEIYSDSTETLGAELGDAVTPEEFEEALKERWASVVALVSSETSTGAWTNVKEIAKICQKYGSLLIVDHVSGVGNPYYMDEWKLDATVTTTHESFSAPPGLAVIAFSSNAIEKNRQIPKRNLYFNLPEYLKSQEAREPPFTVPTTLLKGLRRNLAKILEEGVENYFLRHERNAVILRQGLEDLGLSIFTKPRAYSNTVTAVQSPVSATQLTTKLREEYGINIATGKDILKEKVVRISHAGVIQAQDIEMLLESLAKCLKW